jgi:beta-glucosidase
MDLPGNVSKLISAVLKANPNTVIITQSGTPINMLPFTGAATTQVHAWYNGNETGNGISDVLFGNINPSARLPLSFPRKLSDNPAFLNFTSERGRVIYGEDVYVGYRYYEKLERDVLFPFG